MYIRRVLDRALLDRFVCGLSNPKIQNKLLNTEELTFEKVCRVAKSMEMAERNTQEFHPTSSESNQVNKLTEHNYTKNIEQSELVCHRCGGNHSGQSCKFRSAKCYKRSKIGHLASVCHSKDSKGKGKIHSVRGFQSRANVLESDSDELGIYSLYSLDTNKPHCVKFTVELKINGKNVRWN